MPLASSLNFRVIFKATFESNLPPGGFLQKDFPLDFYLVFCTLPSASSGETLRNCFQIHHLVSCRTLVETLPGLCLTALHLCLEFWTSAQPLSLLLSKTLLMNSLLEFTSPTKRWSTAAAECGAIHGHIVKSQLLFHGVIDYITSFTFVRAGASQLTRGAGCLQAQTDRLLKPF